MFYGRFSRIRTVRLYVHTQSLEEPKVTDEEEFEKEMNEEKAKCDAILELVKSVCDEAYYESIIEYMRETCNGNFAIEEQPTSKGAHVTKWDISDEGYQFDHVFGWQSNGYTGDDYSGEIFIPLPNKKYLKYWFCC
jgi:hypothetical protein